jgi:hypothetical protein
MLESLRLNWPDALQAAPWQRLGRHWAPSEQHEKLEPVLEDVGVCSLAREREEVLLEQPIHAYHCAREPSHGFLSRHGLQVTDVAAHQAEFLERF